MSDWLPDGLPLNLVRDPMLQADWAVLLAIVFAVALAHKIRRRDEFAANLAGYRLLSPASIAPAAMALVAAEALTIVALTWASTRSLGMLMAASLLALYGGAMAINLARGRRDIDCGCGGQPQRLDWLLVWRNGVLVLLSLCFALPAIARPIEPFDYVAGLAVSLGFYGIYCVADELIRQAVRLNDLRNGMSS